MLRSGVRAASFLAVAALALAGCSLLYGLPQETHGPTPAPGGLSEERARSLAISFVPGAAEAGVVWADIASDPFAARGAAPPGKLVWIVRLQGNLDASPCPSGFLDHIPTSSDGLCLDRDGGVDVVIDYFDGSLMGWIH